MAIKKLHSLFTKKNAEIDVEAPELSAPTQPVKKPAKSKLTFTNTIPTPPARPALQMLEHSLAGNLLVATPLVNGSIFKKSVIYLFAHNEDGAMGCIINQPVESVHYSSLMDEDELSEPPTKEELTVYFGGPVERARGFVLHTPDYNPEDSLISHPNVSITAASSILHDMVKGSGPARASLMVGYAGWSAGQLEQELESNSWITVPATDELLFNTPDELKWSLATQSLGFDMSAYSHAVGHA